MSITTILLVLLILFISNKVADYFFGKSQIKKENSKLKIIMPGVNTLCLYSFNDFREKIKEYLLEEFEGLSEVEEEFFIAQSQGEKILFYIRQVKEFSESVDIEDFYILIAEAKIMNINKAILITNGKASKKTKSILLEKSDKFDLGCLEGNELVKKLSHIKREKVLKGE